MNADTTAMYTANCRACLLTDRRNCGNCKFSIGLRSDPADVVDFDEIRDNVAAMEAEIETIKNWIPWELMHGSDTVSEHATAGVSTSLAYGDADLANPEFGSREWFDNIKPIEF